MPRSRAVVESVVVMVGVGCNMGRASIVRRSASSPGRVNSAASCHPRELRRPASLAGKSTASSIGVANGSCSRCCPRTLAPNSHETGTDDRGLARAIEDGLRAGVDRLEKTGQLPKASALLPSVADQLGISESLLDLIPDSMVDDLLPTADVLRSSLDNIDVNAILAGLDDRKSLESMLRDALVQGAIEELKRTIKDGLPDPLQGLLG